MRELGKGSDHATRWSTIDHLESELRMPMAGAGGDMAQLVCNNPQCRVVLMYPRGASQVQCSVCGNLNCAMQASLPALVDW